MDGRRHVACSAAAIDSPGDRPVAGVREEHSVTDDLSNQLRGLMDNPDIGAKLRELMPDGFDPAKLGDILKGHPDIMAKIKELLPDVDIEGALAGLTGAASGAVAGAADTAGDAAGAAKDTAGDAAGEAKDTLGGIVDKVKDLFGR